MNDVAELVGQWRALADGHGHAGRQEASATYRHCADQLDEQLRATPRQAAWRVQLNLGMAAFAGHHQAPDRAAAGFGELDHLAYALDASGPILQQQHPELVRRIMQGMDLARTGQREAALVIWRPVFEQLAAMTGVDAGWPIETTP